jgi:lysophospholipase L1-like esterase
MNVQKGKALLRYIGLVTAVGIGMLLLVELGAWVLRPGRYEDPPPVTADAWIYSDALSRQDTVWMKEFVDEFCRSYHAHWTSYVYFKRNPFAGKHITVDSNGIRRTSQPHSRESSGVHPARVFLFGGSTMWGTGARDSGTIPSALSRIIASDSDVGPTTVVNMGESGYVSTQSVLRLELELRNENIPDIVILYDGINDVFSAYQNGEPGLPQNEMHRATEFNLLNDGKRMRELGLSDLLGRTVTAGVVRGIQSAISPPASPTPPRLDLAGDIVRLYRENLEIVKALSRHYGFRYEAYWQPVVFSRKNPSFYEQSQSDKQRIVRPLFVEAYSRVGQDSVLRSNPQFHDMSDIFDKSNMPVYLDFCHISEAGNAIVAQRMYDDIRTLLRFPRK